MELYIFGTQFSLYQEGLCIAALNYYRLRSPQNFPPKTAAEINLKTLNLK